MYFLKITNYKNCFFFKEQHRDCINGFEKKHHGIHIQTLLTMHQVKVFWTSLCNDFQSVTNLFFYKTLNIYIISYDSCNRSLHPPVKIMMKRCLDTTINNLYVNKKTKINIHRLFLLYFILLRGSMFEIQSSITRASSSSQLLQNWNKWLSVL